MCLKFRNLCIQTKLVITYSFFILFSTLILGFISYIKSAETVENQAIQMNSKVLQQINRNVDYNIKEMERISLTPFSDPGIQKILRKFKYTNNLEMINDRYTMDYMILNLVILRPDIVGIYIFPIGFKSTGEVYYRNSIGTALRQDFDITKEPWYDSVGKANGKKVILGTHLETQVSTNQRKVFSLVRKIKDVDYYRDLGIILIDANLNAISEICADSNLGENGKIIIAGQDGYIVYHTDQRFIGEKLGDEYQGALLGYGISYKKSINGKMMLLTSSKSEYTGWTAIGIIPVDELNRGVALIRSVTILLGVICLTLGIFVAVFIAKEISNPIRRLQQLMKEAEKGNFSVKADVGSEDEIGQVSRSFNCMIDRIKELINTVYESQLMRKEAELAALQSQINPHFLYNTLEVIRGIALANKVMSIVDISKSLAMLFRYSISRDGEFVTLREEINYVRNYLKIQKFRYGDKFDIVYNIDEDILKCCCIRLLLQPLVENAIYHGLEKKTEKGVIEIFGIKNESDIYLRVIDDGIGMTKEQAADLNEILGKNEGGIFGNKQFNRGIGILNVNARIKLHYGEQYGLRVGSQPDFGTVVEISIPVVKQEEGDLPC